MRWTCALALLAGLLPRPAAAQHRDLLGPKARVCTERRGDGVPKGLNFVDETGKAVRLDDYGRGRPVVLVPAFFTCRLQCPLTLEDLAKGLSGVTFEAGREYDVVIVSFDPR